MLRLAAVLLLTLPVLAGEALAQTETWRWRRGSSVGPGSELEPHCVKLRDGSIECRPRVRQGRGDSPARPEFNPFPN